MGSTVLRTPVWIGGEGVGPKRNMSTGQMPAEEVGPVNCPDGETGVRWIRSWISSELITEMFRGSEVLMSNEAKARVTQEVSPLVRGFLHATAC